MAKITRTNGHRLDDIAHIQPGVGALESPDPDELDFDLDAGSAAMASLSAEVPPDALTAQTPGTERTGNGVVIDERGLVLVIGYPVSEAATVTLRTARGGEADGSSSGARR